jgi:hypothetical protein
MWRPPKLKSEMPACEMIKMIFEVGSVITFSSETHFTFRIVDCRTGLIRLCSVANRLVAALLESQRQMP